MSIALISDIHANLPALEAVLADIAARDDITATYHLGDLVGYAPWPNETVAMLREAGMVGIAGNYDSTVATDYKHCGCKYEDRRQEELSHIRDAGRDSCRPLRGLRGARLPRKRALDPSSSMAVARSAACLPSRTFSPSRNPPCTCRKRTPS